MGLQVTMNKTYKLDMHNDNKQELWMQLQLSENKHYLKVMDLLVENASTKYLAVFLGKLVIIYSIL